MKKIMTMDEFNNLIRNLNIPEAGDTGHVDDHKQIAMRLRVFPRIRIQLLVKTAENEWTLSAGGEEMTGLTDAEIDDNINQVIQDDSIFVVTHSSEIYEPFSSTPVNTNVSVYVGGAEAYSSLVTSDDIHDLIMTTKDLESRLEALEATNPE